MSPEIHISTNPPNLATLATTGLLTTVKFQISDNREQMVLVD